MSYLLGHAARCSFTNPLKASYKFSKHYSVLSAYKTNNLSDNFLNRKTPLSNQNIQSRNFSVQDFVHGYFNFYTTVANSAPANFFIEQLVNFHDCGVPWWATISLTCISLRTLIIFPMIAAQDKEVTDMYHASLKMKDSPKIAEKDVLLLAKKNNWTQQRIIQEIKIQERKTKRNVMKEFNYKLKIYRVFVGIITQVCLWTFVTVCLRKLWFFADDKENINGQVLKYELSNEGVLWFKNLLVPDKYGIPILVLLGNLAITELFCLKRGTQTTLFTYILRVVFLLLAYVTSIMPSNITLFWLVSTWTAFGQHLLLLSPRFRKFVRLPPSIVDPHHPFKLIRDRFRIKWGF